MILCCTLYFYCPLTPDARKETFKAAFIYMQYICVYVFVLPLMWTGIRLLPLPPVVTFHVKANKGSGLLV